MLVCVLLIWSGVGNIHKMCLTVNVCDVCGDFGVKPVFCIYFLYL